MSASFTPSFSASSLWLGSRPSASRSTFLNLGSSSALRPIAVMFCSMFTIMTSPMTRALWLCEFLSPTGSWHTTFGFFGSETSRMLVASPSLLVMWPT
ncbi:hypothetical protein D3C83_73970 [compost metagenome]